MKRYVERSVAHRTLCRAPGRAGGTRHGAREPAYMLNVSCDESFFSEREST